MKTYTEDQVRELDLRRQKQIANQVNSIDRLMDGSTYDQEMKQLHEDLAAAQTARDLLQQRVDKANVILAAKHLKKV